MRRFSTAALSAAFFVAGSPVYSEPTSITGDPVVKLVKESPDSAAAGTFAPTDFPWNLPEGRTEDVRVILGEVVLTMSAMDVEKDGDTSVKITAPDLVISQEPDWSVHGGLKASGATMLIERRDDTMVADGSFETIEFGGGKSGGSRGQFEGLEFTFIASDYELAIAAMEADEPAGSEAMMSAMRALDFSLDYGVRSTLFSVDSRRAKDGGPPVDFTVSSGPSDTSVVFGDGRLGFSANGVDNALNLTAPMPVEAEIGLLAYSLTMPTEASADPQSMRLAVELGDVQVSEFFWSMVDPKKVFPRALDHLKADIDLNVIIKESMFDTAARDSRRAAGGRALDPVDVTLKALEFDGLGLNVSGRGNVEMDGEKPKDVSAFLSIAGLSEFMINAVKAEFLKQPQAIMAEGLALQFAEENDDGSLTFDVDTLDGMIIINEKPVVPLPK